MTILEVVIALAIMAIIFSTIVPIFRIIQNSWASNQGTSETIQNGRVLTDHITRNISKAVQITSVSESTDANGFIEFQDNDGNTLRYDIAGGYVQFGVVGSQSDLAGPVSQLQFTCYDGYDTTTPISDVNDVDTIRYVTVETTIINPATLAADKTFTASAYIYTNANSVSPAADPNLVAYYEFEGDYTNTITGLAADPCGPAPEITSDANEPERGQILGLYNRGYKFQGDNYDGDYVNCGNDDVNHIETAITVACWERLYDPNGDSKSGDVIVGKSYPWKFAISSSSTFTFAMSQVEPLGVNPISVTNVFDGQWHHLAGTYDGTTQALYVDGYLEASEAKTGTINIWDGYIFLIGGETNKTATFLGFIDDVCIYDKALDANEILDLCNNGPSLIEEDQILP